MNIDERPWDVVVLGSANFDLYREPDGTEHALPGGKGANQAVAAARAGAQAAFVGRVGNDAHGDELLYDLKAQIASVETVSRDDRAATGICRYTQEEGRWEVEMCDPGANTSLSMEEMRRAEGAITGCRVFVCGLTVPPDCVEWAIGRAHETGAFTMLDPSPSPIPDTLWPFLDLIKPDAEEARALVGFPVEDRESAHAAAGRLLERGVRAVAIEGGKQGNLFAWHGGELWLDRCEVGFVDSTGSGDAMLGTLAAEISRGHAFVEAAPLAHCAAALATTLLGGIPAMPRRNHALELLRATPGLGAQESEQRPLYSKTSLR